MATQTTTSVTDDIDGTDGAKPVHFSIDGQRYEIDLSPSNRDSLLAALAPYIEAGRPEPIQRSRQVRTAQGSKEVGMIRTWAKSNGIDVSSRGRIPLQVREKYQAAHAHA